MFTKMKITLNLNPNHIEFIQYKLDDENSLRFTFDTESSDTTPTITLVPSQSKMKLEKDKQEQKVVETKKHFQDILKKANSVTIDKKLLSPLNLTNNHRLDKKLNLVRREIEDKIERVKQGDLDEKTKKERITNLYFELMEYEFAHCETKDDCIYIHNRFTQIPISQDDVFTEFTKSLERIYNNESAVIDNKYKDTPLDITPLDLPPIVNNTFNELKSEDKEQSKWVNSNSPEAMKLCGKKSRPSQRFEEQVAEKYKKLDNEYYNSK